MASSACLNVNRMQKCLENERENNSQAEKEVQLCFKRFLKSWLLLKIEGRINSIYDKIACLGSFAADSNAWYDCQKNSRKLSREFDNDLEHPIFCLIGGALAERRLDEALAVNAVSDENNAYQHSVDILNGIQVDEDQQDLRSKDMGFEPNDAIARKSFKDGLQLICEENLKKQQGAEPIRKLEGELKKQLFLMDIFSNVVEKGA